MSNETRTYVTISRAEHDRLQREARNASSLSGQVAAMSRLQEAMGIQNRAYQQQIQNLTAQANSTVRVLSGLQTQNVQLRQEIVNAVTHQNQQLQAIATRHQQEMATMNREFAQTIGNVRNELHETSQLITRAMDMQRVNLENQMQNMERQLQREMHTMQDQIDAVDQTVHAMQKDDAALREIARTYAQASNTILQELQAHRTNLITPNRMPALVARLDNINNDLNSNHHGLGASARAEARELLSDVLTLRQEVLLAEQRWERQHQLAIQILDRVDAQIEASREIVLEGETEPQDVDYWSCGEITRLQGRLNAIREEAANPNLSVDQMEALQAAAAEISEEISETVYFAAAAFRASCNRYDIISDLERELFDGENGRLLQLDDDSYQGQDPRAGFRARFKNPQTGVEMAVTIRPEIGGDGELGNSFTYEVVEADGAHNAAFAASIMDHIANVLRSRGLECSTPQELPEGDSLCNEAATRFNVEHWRNETATTLTPPQRNSQNHRRTSQPPVNARQTQHS